MDKYSISQAEVELVGNKEVEQAFEKAVSTTVFKGLVSWHWTLAKVIGKVTHTKSYSTFGTGYSPSEQAKVARGRLGHSDSGKQIAFFGTPENAAIATMLFDRWVILIADMGAKACTTWCHELAAMYPEEYATLEKKSNYNFKYIPEDQKPLVFKATWLTSCVLAMYKKVIDQEEERSKVTSSALVLYDDKVAAAYTLFSRGFTYSKTGRSFPKYSPEGAARGRSVGSNLSISMHDLPE
jgi:hypothetical protein